MIDYIKLHCPDRDEAFNKFKSKFVLDEFRYSRFDRTKEEFVNYETYKKKFQNMDLVITNKTAYVHNSLHRFYNLYTAGIDGNFNDFAFSSISKAINILTNILEIPANQLILSQNLEFGLNLEVPFEIKSFIISEALLYRFKPHTFAPEPNEDMIYKDFETVNDRIRLYDKGRQQSTNPNILRIELKMKDRREFSKYGIETLEDLNNPLNLQVLYDKLYDKIKKDLVVIDSISDKNFSSYLNRKLYSFSSSKYWDELKRNNKDLYKMEIRKLSPFLEKHKLLEHKKVILSLMEAKFNELIIK
ncbi:hypothetical protein CBW16_10110 [Flavobacteriaceae bacterium JJC]|nr:hypothetical protein CBW16_10110 [Flavobacteriaceae bacterium JJC]